MRRSSGGLANWVGSRPMIRTALNSASQQRYESSSFLNQAMERRASGGGTSEESAAAVADEGGGGTRSVNRSETFFWKSSRSSSSWSWLLSMAATVLRRILIRFRNEPWLSAARIIFVFVVIVGVVQKKKDGLKRLREREWGGGEMRERDLGRRSWLWQL